ncbi:MAG: PqqD family peptide modification chaperone [Acidimicrobiales bacterium]
MDPEAIELPFVPARREGLAVVPAGAELLIVDGRADRPHLLSPTAALVWSFIDGTGSLADFATDLVEVLGLDRPRVEADLVDLARDLGRRGLLTGIDGEDLGDLGEAAAAADPAATGPVHLTAPANVGLDARFDRPGSCTTTVRDGPVELDLRVDDRGLAEELVARLGEAGIVAGPPCPTGDRGSGATSATAPLYSVLLGRPSGPVSGLHLLYRSGRPLRRCRHRADLLRITVADLDAVLDRQTHRRSLLDAVGLTRDGRLVAVDPVFSAMVDDLERRLRREGIERVDASLVALAPCDPGVRLAGLVLRPAADAEGSEPTVAALALRAVDLARGLDGRISPDGLAQLCRAVTDTRIVRVPGRAGLRTAVLDLLA